MSVSSTLLRTGRLVALASLTLPVLAGCGGLSFINTKTKFSSSEYGVAASPRVTSSRHVAKGGGRYHVGKPYKVAGRWYTPVDDPNYSAVGNASWYGPNFHGRKTANGEVFDQFALSAAHPTLPLPSYARVTNLDNGRSVIVRVNDRGPFVSNRVIDLSQRSAQMLGYTRQGTARVQVDYVGRAPLEGDDTRFLMASYEGPPPDLSSDRVRVARSNSSSTLVGAISAGISGLFSYAPDYTPQKGDALIDDAFGATQAMAGGNAALADWQKSVDMDARQIDLTLGVFAREETIFELSQAFALLGAVDSDSVQVNGRTATRLRLSYLKPGVTRDDVMALVHMYDLEGVILRD